MAFSGRGSLELVGEADGNLVAYGRMDVRLARGPYEMRLYVAPAHRGPWEAPLLEGLVRLAQGRPRHSLRAYVSESHPEALQAFERLGFETLRVLDQMSLELT